MIKLRVLTLGLLAALAIAGLQATSAGAVGGGHFVSSAWHTKFVADQFTFWDEVYFRFDGSGAIRCSQAYAEGTSNSTTPWELYLTPYYEFCTTSESGSKVTIDENGCSYRYVVAYGGGSGTVSLDCPPAQTMFITHPNCTVRIPSQLGKGNVSYSTQEVAGRHTLTMSLNEDFEAQYEGGICIFLGTAHTVELEGSTELRGYNTDGALVSITRT